jgi:hypothetical protein
MNGAKLSCETVRHVANICGNFQRTSFRVKIETNCRAVMRFAALHKNMSELCHDQAGSLSFQHICSVL